ncbi:MAG: hypothetical protein H6818_19455 [Phycisphaerales bacterium]|nr:hypothetical protein [Phycisphaerales bacterium]MCB9863643.1 hypothetical protein [Phycisphaerales bacterium]
MTVPRALFILFLMVAIGVAIVVFRGESARAANRIQQLHAETIELEQRLWSAEIELARMREPRAIRQRAADMNLSIVPPEPIARPRQ